MLKKVVKLFAIVLAMAVTAVSARAQSITTWEETALSDIADTDVFVIVGTLSGGRSYAMSNDNGTTSTPSAVQVSITTEGTVKKLSSAPADNLKWHVSVSGTSYIFYPGESGTSTWLYMTTGGSSNARVGTNTNYPSFDDTYSLLYRKGMRNTYYLYVSNSQWTASSSNSPSSFGCTTAFYVKRQSYANFTLDSIPTTWTVLVNGEATTVTAYTEGNTSLGYSSIVEGATVKLVPSEKSTVKSVTVTTKALKDENLDWTFTMPSAKAAVAIEYKVSPDIHWLYVINDIVRDMPTEGVRGYHGFESLVIPNISFSGSNAFLTDAEAGNVALRFGSTDTTVVNFSDAADVRTIFVKGIGSCMVYTVFDGDTSYLYDSAAFAVTVLAPHTLTLAANGQGTVSPLLGGASTLLTTITAADNSSFTSGSQTFDGVATVSLSGNYLTNGGNSYGWYCSSSSNTATVVVEPMAGYTIDSVKFYPADGGVGTDTEAPFVATVVTGQGSGDIYTYLNGTSIGGRGVKKIEVYGAVAGSDSIVASTTEGQYLVIPGATVQVVAEAQDGNYVQGWNEIDKAVTNVLSDTATIVVNQSQTLTATFAQNPLLTLATDGQGSVKLDGYTPAGEGGQTVVTFGPGENSKDGINLTGFQWNGSELFIFGTVTSTIGNITSIVVNGWEAYISGAGWSDGTTWTGNATSVSGGGSVTEFTSMVVTVAGEGTPAVYPDGVTAGTTANTYRVLPGTQLSVTATPGEGSYLAQWSDQTEPVEGDARLGSSHPYTMPATDATLTATFNEIPVLTLASNNSEWGSVTLDGVTPGATTYDITIEGGDTYTNVSFPFHTTVFLHEELDEVYYDDNLYPLSAVKNGSNADITISEPYDGARTIQYGNIAGGGGVKTIFCRAVEGLPIMPEGVVTYAGYGNYLVLPGAEVKVIATPDSAHYFVNWDEEAALNSNTAVEKTLTMGFDDTELTANFEHKPTLTLAQNENWGSVTVEGAGSGSGGPVDVTIGDSTSTTVNSYIPSYSLYQYSYIQEIYTASEIGAAGTIQSLTMWLRNTSSYTRNIEIYMKEIEESTFADNTSWVSLSDGDLVATGTIVNEVENPTATTYTLDTPFEYSGNGNLLLCIRDVTGNWSSGVRGTVTDAVGNQAIYTYCDGTPFDISNPGTGSGVGLIQQKNVVKFHIAAAAASITQLTDNTYRVDYGTEVTVKADATELHHVANWEDQNGTELTGATYSDYFITTPQNLFPAKSALTFTMTQDTMAKAMFGLNSYDVTATVATDNREEIGTGLPMGTVSATYVAQDGTPDQSVSPAANISYTAQGGSQSTLVATANYGYLFSGWQVGTETYNTATLTLTESATVTALFVPDTFTVSATPSIAGSATLSGTGRVAYRESTTLAATPETGYHFVKWTTLGGQTIGSFDNINGTLPTITLTAMRDTAVMAVVDTNVYNVTVNVNEVEGSVEGPATVKHFVGGSYTATATPCYHFVNWTDAAGAVLGSEATLVMNATSDTAITANYALNVYTGDTTAVECDQFVWHGETYTVTPATAPTFVYKNANNCDSTVTLHLTVNYQNTGDTTAVSCDTYDWYEHTGITASTETLTHLFEGANQWGCDSTVTLHLTVNYRNTGDTSAVECDQFSWYEHTGLTASTETLTHLFAGANQWGCDSTVTLHLTVNYQNTGVETATACDEYKWQGKTYTESNTLDQRVLKNIWNCDSTVTLNLTVNYHHDTAFHAQGTGSYTWGKGMSYEETFTDNDVYSRTISTYQGCDSNVTITVAIASVDTPIPDIYSLMDRVLMINHFPEGVMDKVDYIYYRWYRNGVVVKEGVTADSYDEGGAELNGCYYLEISTETTHTYWAKSNELCFGTLGIDAANGELSFTLAPNPAVQGARVVVAVEADEALLQHASLRVFDARGRVVMEMLDGIQPVIEANMARGTYLVQVILADGRKATRKLIVQ